jgi:hypothetical protein
MDFDRVASKFTVSDLQIHQFFSGRRSLRAWQCILLGVSLAGGSVSATTVDPLNPEPPSIFPDGRQKFTEGLPDFTTSQPLRNAGATVLAAGLQVPTVDMALPRVEVEPSIGTTLAQAQLLAPISQAPQEQPSKLSPSQQLNPSFSTDGSSEPDMAAEVERDWQVAEEQQSDQESSPTAGADPELGDLYLRPAAEAPERPPETSQALDPELGNLRLQEPLDAIDRQIDPELGNIRLRQQVAAAPPQPTVYLQGRFDYFQSDNIFSEVQPIQDSLIRSGLTLWAAPQVGRNTYVIASVSGNLIRYADLSDFDYNELLLGASIYHQLSPRMYGELGWTNQQLFSVSYGDRFLNDHSLRLGIGRRDPLGQSFALQSFYQLRLSFADPDERSRVINSLGASLIYTPAQRWQASLDYQYVLSDFTQKDQQDDYHQILGVLTYRPSRSTQLTLFGGFSFGSSTDPNIDFDSSLLGVSLFFNLPLL